ncbi:MAG: sigma-70 family RNA polymerase sigma factor [Verrucomicrobiales bacterium]|nr:sigma-70 family RNA polymerase sigma factor [Verrucomicrobiae bacterium]
MNVLPKQLEVQDDLSDASDQSREAQLLAEIANGNRHAFRELCDMYHGLIFTVVHRVLNDAEDSKDMTQEVLWQIWKKASSFELTKGKPRTWMVTMARNRAIDRVRANGRRARLRDAATQEALVAEQMSDSNGHPEKSLEATERREIVRSAILNLTPKQQEVIELAYFAELTQVQIADQLNEPLGTVKARIRRSVKRLHDIVGDKLVP